MPTVTADGIKSSRKDWGSDRPIVLSQSWPVSAGDCRRREIRYAA